MAFNWEQVNKIQTKKQCFVSSGFADLCLNFADFDLRGDYEFSVPTRSDLDLLSLNIKPRPRTELLYTHCDDYMVTAL